MIEGRSGAKHAFMHSWEDVGGWGLPVSLWLCRQNVTRTHLGLSACRGTALVIMSLNNSAGLRELLVFIFLALVSP